MLELGNIFAWGIASIKGSERKLKLRLSKAKPNICFLYPNSRHLFLFLIFCLPLIGFFDQAEVQNPKYTVLWPYLANDKWQGHHPFQHVLFNFPPMKKNKDCWKEDWTDNSNSKFCVAAILFIGTTVWPYLVIEFPKIYKISNQNT